MNEKRGNNQDSHKGGSKTNRRHDRRQTSKVKQEISKKQRCEDRDRGANRKQILADLKIR